MSKQPSLHKIITIDYAAFVAFLFPIITWGLYVLLLILQRLPATDIVFPAIASSVTAGALGILAWRVRLFYSVFSDGLEVPATLSNVFFFRDRGRVDYIYTFQGEKYASGNAIHKVKQTEALQVGQQVVVVIDRNNPKRAFIRDLYL